MARDTVSEQLRAAIERCGQTQDAIAKGADIDAGQVSRFLRGERGINANTLDKLCEYFKLELAPKKGQTIHKEVRDAINLQTKIH